MSGYMIDGKPVRKFLFAHVIVSLNGVRHPELVQVEAFNVDHAISRLVENIPHVPKREWELLEELDVEHEVGSLGRTLPMFPNGVLLTHHFKQ